MRALLALALLLAPWHAEAQDCAEGRVRIDGLCCWPGQTFSSDHRCAGTPECPEGLVEHGEACIAPAIPAPPSYARFEALPPMGTSDLGLPSVARSSVAWPEAHEGTSLHRAVMRHGEDGGLVAAAMVVFDIGWTFGMLVGILEASSANCAGFSSGFGSSSAVNCNSWALAFIPVGGGTAAGLMNFSSAPSGSTFRNNSTWGASFGSASATLQTTGLIMMAVALANEVHDFGMIPLGEGVGLSILPVAPATDGGLSGIVTF